MILAGDVGATKILLEVGDARSGAWKSAHARRYATGDAASFPAVLAEFIAEWRQIGGGSRRIAAAAIGVAGPASGNRVKMTHRPWTIDGDALSARFGVGKTRVVNDLVAVAHGIDWVDKSEILTIQGGKAVAGEPRVVLGVGTGLGVAYLVPNEDGSFRELPGEGGHMGFAPATPTQIDLWRYVHSIHGRVSAEDVASGRGLNHIYDSIRGRGKPIPGPSHAVTAETINENAARGDPDSVLALALFSECLGNIAGDHALAVLARGGVYLAGGVVTKTLASIRNGRFREAFCAKSPHSALMMKIPVRAISSERVGVLGAARLALQL